MGLVDDEDGWDGPEYIAKHVHAIKFIEGSQLYSEMTAWNGKKAFDLMSLSLPKEGEVENAEQKEAREIVEACLQKSQAVPWVDFEDVRGNVGDVVFLGILRLESYTS